MGSACSPRIYICVRAPRCVCVLRCARAQRACSLCGVSAMHNTRTHNQTLNCARTYAYICVRGTRYVVLVHIHTISYEVHSSTVHVHVHVCVSVVRVSMYLCTYVHTLYVLVRRASYLVHPSLHHLSIIHTRTHTYEVPICICTCMRYVMYYCIAPPVCVCLSLLLL